jgi:hypothetical protein
LGRANAADDAKSDFSGPMQDLLSSEPDGLRAAFRKTNAPPHQKADLMKQDSTPNDEEHTLLLRYFEAMNPKKDAYLSAL